MLTAHKTAKTKKLVPSTFPNLVTTSTTEAKCRTKQKLTTKSSWQRGERIISIRPIVMVAELMDRLVRCDSCLDIPDSFHKCSACKNIVYCSKECQMKEWSSHKLECAFLKPANHDPHDRTVEQIQQSVFGREFRLLLKLLVVFIKSKESVNKLTDSARLQTVNDLKTLHSKTPTERLNLHPEFEEYYMNIKDFFAAKGKPIPEENICWLLYTKVFSHQVMLSCFGSSEDNEPMFSVKSGFGILPSLSVFARSCDPTAEIHVWKGEVNVVALTDICDISEVSIMHGEVLQVVELRQQLLEYSFLPQCVCQRCCKELKEPYLLACSNTSCDGVCLMDKKSLQCTKCLACGDNAHHLSKKPELVVQTFHSLIGLPENSKQLDIHKLRKVLSRKNNPFHSQQLGILSVHCLYANYLLETSDKSNIEEGTAIYKDIILPGYKKHAFHNCIQTGMAYFIYGMALGRAYGINHNKDVLEAFQASQEKLQQGVSKDCGVFKTLNFLLEMMTSKD